MTYTATRRYSCGAFITLNLKIHGKRKRNHRQPCPFLLFFFVTGAKSQGCQVSFRQTHTSLTRNCVIPNILRLPKSPFINRDSGGILNL